MTFLLNLLFILLNVLDALITDDVVAEGGKEVAPIKWLFGEKLTSPIRWSFKLTVAVGILFLVNTFVPWPIDIVVLVVLDAVFAWVVWHNLNVLERLKAKG